MGKKGHLSKAEGVTLDAGALIALERGDERITALLSEVVSQRCVLRVPAGVVGQVWRRGKRQARLAQFLRAREVDVVALDDRLARACGELCGAAQTDDVIDASVVLVARKYGDAIVTSDPNDLRHLDRDAMLRPL